MGETTNRVGQAGRQAGVAWMRLFSWGYGDDGADQ